MKTGVPVLGFCGWSGSGKTTIIENLAKRLTARGLAVGYLKHDAHRLQVDREGKDTDRLFKSGARSIAAVSGDERFTRTVPGNDLFAALAAFENCDIILAEGYKDAPWEKVWVHPFSGVSDKMPQLTNLRLEIGGRGSLRHGDLEVLETTLAYWVVRNLLLKPIYGGVLIGGKSERMGRPKALIPTGDLTWVERIYRILQTHCNKAYLLGTGPLPPSLVSAERISDPPDIEGPLAGLIGASRFAPYADWLIVAVDMPNFDASYALRLVRGRFPARRFIGARNPMRGFAEPLAAVYSSQLLQRISVSCAGELSISRILEKIGVKGDPTLWDPEKLKNVNTPEENRGDQGKTPGSTRTGG